VTSTLLPFETAFRDWMQARGMGWSPLEIDFNGGARTSGYRLAPASPSRRVVIALHGAGNDALFGWVGLFKQLLLRETEIFTFDLPGHGRTNQTAFSAEGAAVAVHSAIEQCAAACSGLPVHAIGVSLGGAVLLHDLPRLQRRLTSAALLVAPLRIVLSPSSLLGEIGRHGIRVLLREREHYGLTGLIPSFGPFKRDTYPLRLAAVPPEGAFGYIEVLNETLASMELEACASRVDLPVLLVYGERDRVVPIEQGERLARAIPGSALLRVAQGSHLTTPLEPEVTNRILRWIEEHR